MKFIVWYTTHKYSDCSDTARLARRTVKAQTADEAREIVRAMGKAGSRYIGMIHQAEAVRRNNDMDSVIRYHL